MRFLETSENPKIISLADAMKHKNFFQKFFSRLPVDLVFLHGSLAKDNLKPLSDIDVAVLFKKGVKSFKHIAKITDKFSKLLGREDIDLAVLNSGSPVLAMQVLVNGKLLYCRSQKIFNQFRLRAIQRYLATQYLRERFRRYTKIVLLGGSS